MGKAIREFAEHAERIFAHTAQQHRVGHERIAQLPGIGGRRSEVGGRNDPVEHLLRHGRCESARFERRAAISSST